MYLSRLHLDLANHQVRCDLGNRYDLHRTLCRGFADVSQARPLWRLEVVPAGDPPRLLVQSRLAPDWDQLIACHPGYLADRAAKRVDLAPGLIPGQRLRFRLEANPTVTRAGKRYGLVHLEEQLAWLDRQGERAGFMVEGVTVARAERLMLSKAPGQPRITLYAVLYEGALRVRDPTALVTAVDQGLGHGKALGLGLLSLGAG